MSIPYIMTNSGVSVMLQGRMKPVSIDHVNYSKVYKALLDPETTEDQLDNLIDLSKNLFTSSVGKMSIEGDVFKYDGAIIHNALTQRIIALLKDQKDAGNIIKFLDKLMLNPSAKAVNELYSFLVANTLPITDNGNFLAYKKVAWDYKDLYTRTMDNSIGNIVKMTRNLVDDDSSRTCSNGLHCASFSYMSSYGATGTGDKDDRIVIVEVDPQNVVAVPPDYNNQKMRVCEYTVVSELVNDGESKLQDYVCGERDEAFIRKVTGELKTMLMTAVGADRPPKMTEVIKTRNLNELAIRKLLDSIISTYSVQSDVDTYLSKYGDIKVSSLLHWITNWS